MEEKEEASITPFIIKKRDLNSNFIIFQPLSQKNFQQVKENLKTKSTGNKNKRTRRCSSKKRFDRSVHGPLCSCFGCRKNKKKKLKNKSILSFKSFASSPPQLIQSLMVAHGFKYTSMDNYSLGWSGGSLSSVVFERLEGEQRVNSFPRCVEITRKDNLTQNIAKMTQKHGLRHFSFTPLSYVLPQEWDGLRGRCEEEGGRELIWIVKPSGDHSFNFNHVFFYCVLCFLLCLIFYSSLIPSPHISNI